MEAFTPELWSNGVAVGVDKAHEVGGSSVGAAVAAEVAMIGGGVREEPVPAGLAVGMPRSDYSGGMAPSGPGPETVSGLARTDNALSMAPSMTVTSSDREIVSVSSALVPAVLDIDSCDMLDQSDL